MEVNLDMGLLEDLLSPEDEDVDEDGNYYEDDYEDEED